jgi:hypothetical protein
MLVLGASPLTRRLQASVKLRPPMLEYPHSTANRPNHFFRYLAHDQLFAIGGRARDRYSVGIDDG